MTISARLLEARQPDPNKRHVIEAWDSREKLPGPYISPSALETARSCEARWGWAKLEGIREPESASQALGTATHKELEEWLLHATPVRSSILLPALPYFPRPMAPGMTAEKPFALEITRDGTSVVFVGLKDCEQDSTIFDLKTTSDLQWKKSPEVLQRDIQATIYALVNMLATRKHISTCRWVYTQTKGAIKAEISEAVISMDQALGTLEDFFPLAFRMVDAVRTKKKALDMAQNVSSCGMYNKACFYTENCAITPGQKFYALNKQERMREGLEPAHVVVSKPNNEAKQSERQVRNMGMSLKEKLAADLAGKSGGASAMSAAKEVAVIAGEPGVSKFKSLAEKLNGIGAGNVPNSGTEKPNVGRAINPPDAAPDPRAVVKSMEGVMAETFSSVAPAPAPAPTEEKRKPGRPVGSTKKISTSEVAMSSVETKAIVENVAISYINSERANREMEMRFEIAKAFLEILVKLEPSEPPQDVSESAKMVADFARKVVEGIR